jgi:hypothetical protein
MTGDHVPAILLFDVVGNINVPPLHIAATCVNDGVVSAFTVTVIVVVVAQTGVAVELGVNV